MEGVLQLGLPASLRKAIDQFETGEKKHEKGGYYEFDMDCDELNASINSAEISGEITANEAWDLRERYLGVKRQ